MGHLDCDMGFARALLSSGLTLLLLALTRLERG
jgi:hypothetical protein